MKDRAESPGAYYVCSTEPGNEFLGIFDVEYGPASGLMCKELKAGGSIHCPGFSDFSKYLWSRRY